MEIVPLMEHRLTFSQSSKDSIRHKGREYNVLEVEDFKWFVFC